MSEEDAKFAALRAMHPPATLHTEGGQAVALLPELKFVIAGGTTVEMTLLLFPAAHSGYISRLFFERKLEGVGQSRHWNRHTVLGRAWWAPSWKDVSPDQPWTSMLCAHLRAVA
jgi:hypothetical protein